MAMTPIGPVAHASGTESPSAQRLRVRCTGGEYPAEPVARGAAFEIFSTAPEPGFLPNPRPGAQEPYRRFVAACDAEVVDGTPPAPAEPPLSVPLAREVSWDGVHRLSQSPRGTTSPRLAGIRG